MDFSSKEVRISTTGLESSDLKKLTKELMHLTIPMNYVMIKC